jgi:hypothetical protein
MSLAVRGRSWMRLGILCLLPLLATCGGDGPTDVPDPPTPGIITVRLIGSGLVGGLLFEVDGPVGEATGVPGVTVRSATVGSRLRVLAHGNISSGPVVQIAMADVRRVGEVKLTLLQLANVQTFEQISTEVWSVVIDP